MRGNLPQVAGKTEFAQRPDRPFGGIKLPWLHAIAVIVLKLVMIVVISLAEGDERHDPAIACTAPAGVRPRAKRMACGIDAKRAMLQAHHPGDAANQKTTEGTDGPLIKPSQAGRENKPDKNGEGMDITMLEPDEGVPIEIRYIIEGRLRIDLEKQPADVRMEETLADVIRILLVIDELVMPAMLGGPHDRRVLERRGAKDKGEKANRPMGLEGEMREKAVIPEGNTKAAKGEHHPKERDLEPIKTVVPYISRRGGECEKQGSNEETAGNPVDAFKGDSELHRQGWRLAGRRKQKF